MNDSFGHPFGPGKQVCNIAMLNSSGAVHTLGFDSVYQTGNNSNLTFSLGTHTFSGGDDWSFPIRVANANSIGTRIVLKLTVMTTSGTLSIS